MNGVRVIVPPRRSRWSSIASGLAACAIAAAGVGFTMETQLEVADQWLAASLCGFMALATAAMSWRLGLPRGGILRRDSDNLIGLMLTSPRDVWWIDRESCVGIRVTEPDPEHATDAGLFGVVLVRGDAPEIVLVETPDPHLTADAAQAVRAGLDLPETDARAPALSLGDSDHEAWIRVARGVALTGVMLPVGLSMLGIGGILVSQVASHPAVAIFVAPVALLTGAVLLALTLVKRIAWEEISLQGTRWTHQWRFQRFSWGARTLDVADPLWRVRVGGWRGARLELIGTDGEIWIGAGATARSMASVEDLSSFPMRFVSTESAG